MTVQAELDTARAVEGDEVELVLRLKARDAARAARVDSRAPARARARGGRAARLPHSGAGEERAFALPLRCSHFGGYRAGALWSGRSTASASPSTRRRVEASLPLAVFPEAEHLQRLLRPAPDAAVRRQPGRADEGRRDRVRGHPPVRPRRPGPQHQLARERAPAGAPRQRAPPGAQRRRRPLPRQLCRGARRRRQHARPGGARGGGARGALPRAPRPGRAGRVRRLRALAHAEQRAAASCSGSSRR